MEESWQYRSSWKRFAQIRRFEHLPRLSGKRLLCHCLPTHECHADSNIAEYKLLHPEANDREDTNGAVPSSAVLSRRAQLRLEPDSSEGSSPDEGAPKIGSGWTGRGSPLLVGSSYKVREICDGQSLASPGRWAVDNRRYLEDSVWSEDRYAGTLELVGSWEDLQLPFPSEAKSDRFPSDQRFINGTSSRGSVRCTCWVFVVIASGCTGPRNFAGRVLLRGASWAGGPTPTTTGALSDKEEVETAGSRRPEGIWKTKSLGIPCGD